MEHKRSSLKKPKKFKPKKFKPNRFEPERFEPNNFEFWYDLGMLVTAFSWNTNGMIARAWMLLVIVLQCKRSIV